jgi:hypothetical protein
MKIKITDEQLQRLTEMVDTKKVVCECGWSWKLSEGGDDPFICHNCGKNNEE